MYGKSVLNLCDSHLRIETNGRQALAFGGYSEDSNILFSNTDVSVKVRSALQKETLAPDKRICVRNSRLRLVVNGTEIERESTISYETEPDPLPPHP